MLRLSTTRPVVFTLLASRRRYPAQTMAGLGTLARAKRAQQKSENHEVLEPKFEAEGGKFARLISTHVQEAGSRSGDTVSLAG